MPTASLRAAVSRPIRRRRARPLEVARRFVSFTLRLALAIAPFFVPASAIGAGGGGGTLSTPGQVAREVRALEVLASAPLQKATDALEKQYLAHPRGRTKSGAATARRAAASTAAAATYAVVNDDPDRPVVFWGANAPHRWFGLSLPRAGYGIENPDNTYRHLHIDGTSRYEIRGRFPKAGPVELHFTVMDAVPGDAPSGQKKSMKAEGGEFLATLRSDAMAIASDGSFVVTIDSDPANGRENHLQIPKSGRFPVHIRDLFTDWSSQLPVPLEARRVGGPPAAPLPSLETLTERAVARLEQMGPFWMQFNERFFYTIPPDTIPAPRARPGGRGFSASSHFALADDEALVVTLDRLGAGSLGFQIADSWGVAYEYVDRTSSLNQNQAVPNPDGSFTYVVSAKDPGFANWLDPSGETAGILVLRWQVLPEGADPAKAIRKVEVVKLGALEQAMPAGARKLSPEERKTQQSERARQYARRLGQ